MTDSLWDILNFFGLGFLGWCIGGFAISAVINFAESGASKKLKGKRSVWDYVSIILISIFLGFLFDMGQKNNPWELTGAASIGFFSGFFFCLIFAGPKLFSSASDKFQQNKHDPGDANSP